MKQALREREHALRLQLKAYVSSPEFNGRSTTDFYGFGKVLGQGSFGKVRLAWHRLAGAKVAIKSYEKAKLKEPNHWRRVQQEIGCVLNCLCNFRLLLVPLRWCVPLPRCVSLPQCVPCCMTTMSFHALCRPRAFYVMVFDVSLCCRGIRRGVQADGATESPTLDSDAGNDRLAQAHSHRDGVRRRVWAELLHAVECLLFTESDWALLFLCVQWKPVFTREAAQAADGDGNTSHLRASAVGTRVHA